MEYGFFFVVISICGSLEFKRKFRPNHNVMKFVKFVAAGRLRIFVFWPLFFLLFLIIDDPDHLGLGHEVELVLQLLQVNLHLQVHV
jgi:hypothetical protein